METQNETQKGTPFGTLSGPQLKIREKHITPLPPSVDDCGKLGENRFEGREHGNRSTYVIGCRCDACRAANTAYMRDLTRRKMYGELNRVPFEEARWRVRRLMAMGYSANELTRLTGISNTTLTYIRDKKDGRGGNDRRYCNRATLEKLDALLKNRKRDLAGGVNVDGRKTRALFNELYEKLGAKGTATALGWNIRKVYNFRFHESGMVKLSTARHIEERVRLLIKAAEMDKTHAGRMQIAKASGMVVNPYTEEDYERREWWRR